MGCNGLILYDDHFISNFKLFAKFFCVKWTFLSSFVTRQYCDLLCYAIQPSINIFTNLIQDDATRRKDSTSVFFERENSTHADKIISSWVVFFEIFIQNSKQQQVALLKSKILCNIILETSRWKLHILVHITFMYIHTYTPLLLLGNFLFYTKQNTLVDKVKVVF